MTSIFELKKEQATTLKAAESFLGSDGHVMTTAESENYDASMARYEALGRQIHARERVNTIRANFPSGMPGLGFDGASATPMGLMETVATPPNWVETAKPEYKTALVSFLRTGRQGPH